VEVAQVDADAYLIAEYIAQQLERRVSFRRVVRQAFSAQRWYQGIRIQWSVNGQIARTEWTREGECLCTLRADIDYIATTAKTIYGFLASKYGFSREVFPDRAIASLEPLPRRRQQQRRRQQFEDRSNEE